MSLNKMNAVLAAAAIRAGKISSEELIESCLDYIKQVEETVQAWTYLDPDYALQQARKADVGTRFECNREDAIWGRKPFPARLRGHEALGDRWRGICGQLCGSLSANSRE